MAGHATENLKPFSQDHVFSAKHVMGGVLSPDGTKAVYELSETVRGESPDNDRQRTSLWIVHVNQGGARRLTEPNWNATAPQFAGDSSAILFLSAGASSGHSNQVYRLALDAGEARPLTSLPQGVSRFALSPDGRKLAFAAMEKPPKPPSPNEHVRIDRLNYRFDPVPIYLHAIPQAIYVMDFEDGTAKPLTEHDGLITAIVWSPDSRDIAFLRNLRKESRGFGMMGDLCVLDHEGRVKTLVADALVQLPFWTADGKAIGFFAPPDGHLARQSQLWLINRNGDEPKSRTATLNLCVPGSFQVNSPALLGTIAARVDADGRSVFVTAGVGGEGQVLRIALFGEEHCEVVASGPRLCRTLDVANNTLLFAAQDCLHPAELFALDLSTRHERQLTEHNADWRAGVAWPKVEHITVTSGKGATIEAWALIPQSAPQSNKAVLSIHGGPHAAYGWAYHEDMLELAGVGYTVVFCNPRGTFGYGDDFSTAIVGCWGKPEQQDFDALLDTLIARKMVDPGRIGVTGVSGGGHLTAWLIGHGNRFAAAIPEQGMYNLFSMYGVADVGPALVSCELGGKPHECPERYWELSPIAHIHRCTTPTLLIQGERDVRCPMQQGEELFTTMKIAGCHVELLRLQNCNHGLQIFGPPPLRRARMDAIKDWFARFIH